MDRDELIELVETFKAEWRAVTEHLTTLQHREASLAQTVAGLEGLLGTQTVSMSGTSNLKTSTTATLTSYPRGGEAIRQVLQEAGREMTVKEISDELIRRGWAPHSRNPENATSSNASRAAESLPEVARRRGEHGAFVYKYVEQDKSTDTSSIDVISNLEPTGRNDGWEAITS